MSWPRVYRLTLRLLPGGLRRKHGPAMEALFARELERARARGRLPGALAGAAGVWDAAWRGAYEWFRPQPTPASAHFEGPHMPQITTREFLRRLAASFAIAFVALTAALLVLFASKRVPTLSARGATAGTIAEALLLAVPFIAAMTIPMAVLVAVLREFTRLGAVGTRDGFRHLVVPVLGASAGVAVLAFVVTAEIVPRTNERLSAMLTERAQGRSDRTMTIGELREAARTVRRDTDPTALAHAAAYEVEVQKKLALPAACVVMALVGVALALRMPRGGTWLVVGASWAVYAAYYLMLVTGEHLADQLIVPPFVGMWGANALLLAAALLVRQRGRPLPREA